MAKILLVEDDKSLREIYGVRLLAEGYDIVSAGDGEEALAMAIKERPALIVSDVMMPKISGFDMLDILRSTTETKDVKVIMMTALSSEDQRQRGEQLGADRYLIKSQVGIEDVVRAVHEVLGDMPQLTPAPAATAPANRQPTMPQPIARPTVDELSPRPTAPAPMPTTPAPQPPAPAASLPQPTAPFSSPAPRPNSLGDRVIHPLAPIDMGGQPDMAQMIEQELHAPTTPAPAPIETPSTPLSAPAPMPTTPAPQPPAPAASLPQPTAPAAPQPLPTPSVLPPAPEEAPTPEGIPTPVASPQVTSIPPAPQPSANTFPTQSPHA